LAFNNGELADAAKASGNNEKMIQIKLLTNMAELLIFICRLTPSLDRISDHCEFGQANYIPNGKNIATLLSPNEATPGADLSNEPFDWCKSTLTNGLKTGARQSGITHSARVEKGNKKHSHRKVCAS
jgi:hypothetical protein